MNREKQRFDVRASKGIVDKVDRLSNILSGSRSQAVRYVLKRNIEQEIEDLREGLE